MKVNIKISENKETELSSLKGKMLMKDNSLYVIESYSTVEVMEDGGKTIFGRHRPLKEALYVTELTIRGYHGDGKFLGYIRENAFFWFLNHYNLYYFRETWIKFQEQLKAFGFEIKKIEIPAENPVVDEFSDNK